MNYNNMPWRLFGVWDDGERMEYPGERFRTKADLHKYHEPANANGSRARYFHAYLTRAARHEAPSLQTIEVRHAQA